MGHDVPGALKSAWRLLFMATIQVPLAWREYGLASEDIRSQWRGSGALLCATGALSALNYVSFTVGLDHTSLADAVVIANSAPAWFVLTASGLVAMFRLARACRGRSAPQAAVAHAALSAAAAVAIEADDADDSERLVVETTALPVRGAYGGSPDRDAATTGSSDAEEEGGAAAAEVGRTGIPLPPAPSTDDGDELGPDALPPCVPRSAASAAVACLVWFYGPRGPLLPTALEAAGAAVGVAGVVWLVSSKEQDGAAAHASAAMGPPTQPSPLGNALCVVAALSFCAYLAAGARLRRWMPIFLYSAPMTAVAALLASAAACTDPRVSVLGLGPASLFGWAGDAYRCGVVLASAVVPGLLGHTLANFAMAEVGAGTVCVCGRAGGVGGGSGRGQCGCGKAGGVVCCVRVNRWSMGANAFVYAEGILRTVLGGGLIACIRSSVPPCLRPCRSQRWPCLRVRLCEASFPSRIFTPNSFPCPFIPSSPPPPLQCPCAYPSSAAASGGRSGCRARRLRRRGRPAASSC